MQGGRYRRRIRGLSPRRDAAAATHGSWARVDKAVRAIYFQPRVEPAGSETGGEVDWRLVASFLARRGAEVNVLDVDECDSAEAAIRRLRILADAAIGGERAVAR
jgi:hypothetical protein